MVSQTAFQLALDFLTSKPIVVEPSADQVSSDAGLLPFRQLDERIGLTRQFANALTDRRNAGYIDHSFLEMTRMRVYGILADYADQNDHDVLRSDPIFKLLCDRSIKDDDLASQPSRRGHQSRGSDGSAGSRLRWLRRSRREREPQQGTQDRPAGRPTQRSSLLRQPVPSLSTHGGVQPAGSPAS